MSATGNIDYAAAPQEHLLALKAMTPIISSLRYMP